MSLNFKKLIGFVFEHRDEAVGVVESIKDVFGKGDGAKKMDAAVTVLHDLVQGHAEFTGNEAELLAIPEVDALVRQAIELSVQALKVKDQLRVVLEKLGAIKGDPAVPVDPTANGSGQ
jgi:hypothetical protein